MPPPLPAEVIARIVELRQAGLTVAKIAEALGVSRGVVGKHSTALPKFTPPKRGRGRPPGRQFYDDPRFEHPPEDEYANVAPIPFFPGDLPRLGRDPFEWTPAELQSAVTYAHKRLFPKDEHQCISLPATSSFST